VVKTHQVNTHTDTTHKSRNICSRDPSPPSLSSAPAPARLQSRPVGARQALGDAGYAAVCVA
jgi:hypothetical protein